MRLTFSLFLTLGGQLLAAGTAAADTLTIAPAFYHVDEFRHVILINKALADLNADGGATKTHLTLADTYAFSQPVTQLATDLLYQAERNTVRYSVYFTELPIVSVRAKQPIQDTPSIPAKLVLVAPGGQVVESDLGIEFRGSFSQSYPKKSYELSFSEDSTREESRDVSLLGMREDNKYNLQALYNEPLRIRSKTSFALWQEIHQPYYRAQEPEARSGIAMQYVEVFVNDSYQGVYALTERIDRKQLKLKKYKDGITGELYKGDQWGPAVTFSGLPPFDNTSDDWGGFEYKHPDEEIDWTSLYNLVNFVVNSPNQEFFSTYQQKFNLANAVDYYLFLNLARATDNTGKNLYIVKYKQGEPYFYVPWDLDGVFGTYWTGGRADTVNDVLSNGFYDRLWQDCSATSFRATLRTRWAELRQNTLTEDHIMAEFRANNAYLIRNNVYEREQLVWADFHPVPEQLDYIATWLGNRLRYLDATFGAPCGTLTAAAPTRPASVVALYPNPTSDYLTVRAEAAATDFCLRDLRGRVVLRAALRGPLNRLDVRHLAKGLYLATLKSNQAVSTLRLVIN